MEQRLSMVTLGVRDLAFSVAFYENTVGWQMAPGPEGIAFFDLSGIVFALYPHDDLAKDIDAVAANGGGAAYQGFALAHNVRGRDEVDAVFARLKERGATIVKAPEEAFWGGYSGYFADPDGHVWEVAYNPFWPIGTDGRISLPAD